jgi:hypothetical protein
MTVSGSAFVMKNDSIGNRVYAAGSGVLKISS